MKLIVLSLFLYPVIIAGETISLDGEWRGSLQTCSLHGISKNKSSGALHGISQNKSSGALHGISQNKSSGALHGISKNKSSGGCSFPAVVPGGIYTDLVKVGLIQDNLLVDNDVRNRWIGNQSVTYQKVFCVNSTFLKASKIMLIFHGLDTYATIFLNDHKVGISENMFLKYSFEVKNFLMEGSNVLKISFNSSVKVAEDLYNEQSKRYRVPPVCVPKEYNGECHVNHIRKMQASFSWDWGPAFPSVGIWKSVELITVDDVLVTDITVDIYENSNVWKVDIVTFFELPVTAKNNITCDVTCTLIIDQRRNISRDHKFILYTNQLHANSTITLDIPLEAVEKWWPNGYGNPKLYVLRTTVSTLHNVVRKDVRVGFRTVKLIQEPIKNGLTFYFNINGVPIFAKGSNFIPASIFPELSSKRNTIEHLLLSVRETHMNMLRVWGGGVYESDLFYDLADEYGIMIWQDFMFACAMYPTTEKFLNSVREEITQNVRRLKVHPSIVLWAGNNENEAAIYGNWYGTGTVDVYREDYVKLYVNVIKNQMKMLDQTRPYVVSSPSDGLYTENNNYLGPNPYSNLYGDVHYYNYIRNGWDINQYPRTRFASEYGFQSIPSMHTMITASETISDFQVNSTFMKHRQHLPAGDLYMRLLISKNFDIPETDNPIRDFVDFIYLSQINQAVSVRIETEFYRQSMSDLNEIGEGMTMGALYWQLNDVWQAPSWSSIEYGGRWKMLHYYTKEFFAPVIVTSHLSSIDELSLYVVSDKLQRIQNASVKLSVYKWISMEPIKTLFLSNVTIEPTAAKIIKCLWLTPFLVQAGCGSMTNAKNNCGITLNLFDQNGLQIAPINYVYPSALKEINRNCVNTDVNVNNRIIPGKYANYTDFELNLTTSGIALFVWLDVGNLRGRFSENGFHMFEERKQILFHAYEGLTVAELQNNIKITTLSSIYCSYRASNTLH